MVFPKFNRVPLSTQNYVASFIDDNEYSSAFGLQWNTWVNTQLDSHTGLSITRDRTERMFGPIFHEIKGKQVLEAGCGAGRFTEILLAEGAKVTAFDISSAVYANRENNSNMENLLLFRGSVTDIPLDGEFFDVVFCPGVVQHTPNPIDTINSLWEQVIPGGWLVFDQYRHNLSTWSRSAWVFRLGLRRLKPNRSLAITNALVRFLFPLHRAIAPYRIMEKFLFRISPITVHFNGYPELSVEDQFAWAQLATHDNLTDFYKHQISLNKLKAVVSKLAPVEAHYLVKAYTIEVRIKKSPIGDTSTPVSEVTFLTSSDHPSG